MPSSDTQFKPKHGMSMQPDGKRSATYTTWRTMHQRCKYSGHKSFEYYGGKGVKVCERWNDFMMFLNDMGERPKGKTLGRKDGNGDYTPENCQWETHKQQARNRKSTKYVTAFGETLPLVAMAEKWGIRKDTLAYRLRTGMQAEIAVTKPVFKRTSK